MKLICLFIDHCETVLDNRSLFKSNRFRYIIDSLPLLITHYQSRSCGIVVNSYDLTICPLLVQTTHGTCVRLTIPLWMIKNNQHRFKTHGNDTTMIAQGRYFNSRLNCGYLHIAQPLETRELFAMNFPTAVPVGSWKLLYYLFPIPSI